MTRYISLDVGEVRIGVAVSDSTGSMAFPYTILQVSRDKEQTWVAIQKLIEETEAEAIVIGLPISLDGLIHAQGERVQAFGEQLREQTTLPIVYADERLSSVEARHLLYEDQGKPTSHKGDRRGFRSTGGKKRRPGPAIDDAAAAIILRDYLAMLAKQAGKDSLRHINDQSKTEDNQ